MLKASKNLITTLKKQKRENEFLLFLDSPNIIEEASKSGLEVLYLLKTEDANFDIACENKLIIDSLTLNQLSDVKTPQGVIGVVEYIPHVVKKPVGNFLVLDGVQDSGNVGTLIRSAYGAKFNDIYLIESAKAFNMKVIRSSAGASFKANVMELSRDDFEKLYKTIDFPLYKADMFGVNIFTEKLNHPLGFVIGNEGNGVSKQLSNISKFSVSIPMQNGLESLNAGVSGSLLMYITEYGG